MKNEGRILVWFAVLALMPLLAVAQSKGQRIVISG